MLEEVPDATIDLVLSSTLPPPQELARLMSDAALHGPISGWAARPDEQQVFELIGMGVALPRVGGDGS